MPFYVKLALHWKKMVNTVISPPIPAFQNPPIQPGFFKPRVFIISDISLGQTTTVTTTTDLNYVLGQLCRLLIPNGYGSRGLNEQLGYVITRPNDVAIFLAQDPADGTGTYTANLLTTFVVDNPNVFLLPGSIKFYFDYTLPDQTLYIDNGEGLITYVSGTFTISAGTIDYETGAITLTFIVAPPALTTAKASFAYNLGSYTDRVTLDIYSVGIDPFINASLNIQPQIVAVGDINTGFLNSTGRIFPTTTIPGSFQNISPN